MMSFSFDLLPAHPQIQTLSELKERLWQRPEVMAIWLGGSYASGKADRYSDVDLRIAVEANSFQDWLAIDLQQLFQDDCPGAITLTFGPDSVLHHVVLSSGELFDVYVQPFPPTGVESPIIMLAARNPTIEAAIVGKQHQETTEVVTATSEEVEPVIRSFWVNTHKHRKVLFRDLDLLAQVGIGMDRDALRRLWYVDLTGLDEPKRKTIHSLTDQMRVLSSGIPRQSLDVLGMPLTSRKEIMEAIESNWNEVSAVGKRLAGKYNFEYLASLESTVRTCWLDWRTSMAG